MPSIISHAAAGVALSAAFVPGGAPARFWPVAVVIAILPDADSLLHYLRYSPELGHRGFFHSPFLGLMVSVFLLIIFFRNEPIFSVRWFQYLLLFFAVWMSHGLLDAMTNGGSGVAFFSPFSSRRYFLPWTPIQVSPMSVTSFFHSRGWTVLKSEFVWIWLPGLFFVLLSRIIRHGMRN